MSESILSQVENAINRKLYIAIGNRPSGSPAWWRPIRINESGSIVLLWGDCGNENNLNDLRSLSQEQWRDIVAEDGTGLYKQVGIWNFAPANDPAALCIAEANRYPESVGRELYALRQEIKRLRKVNAELLEALCYLRGTSTGQTHDQWIEALDMADKAITKATGGTDA